MNNETDLLGAMNIIESLTTLSRRICVWGVHFSPPARELCYLSHRIGTPEAGTLLNVQTVSKPVIYPFLKSFMQQRGLAY